MTIGKNNFILVVLLSICTMSYPQINKVKGMDTIYLNQDKLMIEIPDLSVKEITNYEEGTIITYTSRDTFIITVFCGRMATLLLNEKDNNCFITDNCQLGNAYSDVRGYCIDSIQNKRYFRRIVLNKYGLLISYEFLKEPKLIYYDKIISNLLYEEAKE